ncbi:HAMP domain-containing protein [Aquincola sp. S2]|uniref:histidine kinase n=1 Tax=Pseudaquabacterium terrae TaxID=2732868 RepID=A0ABX2EEQ8_9BURK|nr:ATP-binding protein [Aquabacterium terrae]NRF67086.1 HAMP domain-containing protein [Aquabacterium terrae]
MTAVVVASFVVLLAILTALEMADQDDLVSWAGHASTVHRLWQARQALEHLPPERREAFLAATSFCHEGYTVTSEPAATQGTEREAVQVRTELAARLRLPEGGVQVDRVMLQREDFAYARCRPDEMRFPLSGLVISIRLASGGWLNAEIHPHEWHLHSELVAWLMRSGAAFLVVGLAAVWFAHRLGRPLARLTEAAQQFDAGRVVRTVPRSGPEDLRRAIDAFNAMQQRIADDMTRRTQTLAAIGHDLRSPLTALRIQAELVEDPVLRAELIRSIDKMTRMAASALAYLQGESREEPRRRVDLAALARSECADHVAMGQVASYDGPASLPWPVRPDALARALRNLIDNANKYASGACVTLAIEGGDALLRVSDTGPGVPGEDLPRVVEPFARLSAAREAAHGGFGLGLAIVRAVAEGHGGHLELANRSPSGLLVTMRLPLR